MKKTVLLFAFAFQNLLFAQSFDLIPLGVYGGGDESNLSAYLVSEPGKNEFLSLDAGTIRSGINAAIKQGSFDTSVEVVLKSYIKGYFISHSHLDHLSGLIINSPDDSKKNIYAFPYVIDVLKNNYFTNAAWSNFANEGESPILNKYTYQRLEKNTILPVSNTTLTITPYELSHGNFSKSSAVLVKNAAEDALLYLGDTGADRIEKSENLKVLWTAIAPLIKSKKLKTILIEVSFPNSQPETALYGHLTPKLLVEELRKLERESGNGSLKGFKIIITHLKPGGDQISTIKTELTTDNPLEVNYIFPNQGEKISL